MSGKQRIRFQSESDNIGENPEQILTGNTVNPMLLKFMLCHWIYLQFTNNSVWMPLKGIALHLFPKNIF